MAVKDLLVYLDQTESAHVRLRLAADLARRNVSHLTALFIEEPSVSQKDDRGTAELGLASGNEMARLESRVHARIAAAEQQLQEELHNLACEHELQTQWRSLRGRASILVPQQARYSDLCVLGQARSDPDATAEYAFSEQVLFVTGRPVLFIPHAGSFKALGRHIAVAWNSSRAAARSLNDAMPLIEHAEQVTVLTANPHEFVDAHHAPPVKHLIGHLRRHCAAANVSFMENVPSGAIADVLMEKAQDLGADLLVAGAFGHARLWEKLLGGVTRDLLARMSLPLLMSY